MRYALENFLIGRSSGVPIDEAEYKAIKSASAGIHGLLGIEDKIDLVLANLASYEIELLSICVYRIIDHDWSWSSFRGDIHSVNRYVINLLSSARMYVDQVKHSISSMFGGRSAEVSGLAACISKEYDSSLAYRVMDGLRNHALHRTLPITSMTWPHAWVGPTRSEWLRSGAVPMVETEALRRDGALKASVLKSLEAAAVKGGVAVTPMVRAYVECVGRIHQEVRRLTERRSTEWAGLLGSMLDRARSSIRPSPKFSVATARGNDGEEVEHVMLSSRVTEEAKKARSRNRSLANLSKKYVSGFGNVDSA